MVRECHVGLKSILLSLLHSKVLLLCQTYDFSLFPHCIELVKPSGPGEMPQRYLWSCVKFEMPPVSESGFFSWYCFLWYSNKKFEILFSCTSLSSCKVRLYWLIFFLGVVALHLLEMNTEKSMCDMVSLIPCYIFWRKLMTVEYVKNKIHQTIKEMILFRPLQ